GQGRPDPRPRTSHREVSRARPRVPRAAREPGRVAWRPAGRAVPARREDSRPPRRPRRLLSGPVDRAEARDPGADRPRGEALQAHRLDQGCPRRRIAEGEDPQRRRRGHGEDAARVLAAPAAGSDQEAAERRSDRRGLDLPREDRQGRDARERADRGQPRARPPGADERAEPRVRMDPHLPRLDARHPVERALRGQRRTYVGALPGRIVRALKDAGTKNPVIMLDEIDKVGSDWRGDPSSALLEVLDPAQNHTFRDHYLEVDLDLSEVLFIPTANVADTIPGPLLDRMELVRLDGYTDEEKLAIAADDIREYLGKPRFQYEVAERTSVPGVATGLAVTGAGGDVLFVEASAMDGEKGALTLTGQLGDVMKESAQIALSYVRSHAEM